MDFELSDRCKELRGRLLAFMDEHVHPAEPVYHDQIAPSGSPASILCHWSTSLTARSINSGSWRRSSSAGGRSRRRSSATSTARCC